MYQVVASGIPTPTYALVENPLHMVIDNQTGLIVWFPEEPGVYQVTVSATNVAGVDYQTYPLRVGGCEYVVGDINGFGGTNGIDVTYGVSYFKGGAAPPDTCNCNGHVWYIAGDVNASCVFNGIDITYLVAFFKGGPDLIPCPACEPVSVVAKLENGIEDNTK
jgi:hypothetical protein